MQVLSLFCGAGGLDLGFKSEGYKIRLAIDSSVAAIATHMHNFPKSVSIQADVIELGKEGLVALCEKFLKKDEPLGIIGGPPCQGFSRSNIKSESNDPRNKLALIYIDFIDELKKIYDVNFIVFENVLGLKDKKHIHTYNSIIENLECIGFNVNSFVLNAKDFGVPQDRKRVIIIALKNKPDASMEFVEKISKLKTVKDTIYGLPEPTYFSRSLTSSEIIHHPNHWTMVPKSKKFKDSSLLESKTRSFRVISWDKPSPTIAYGNREIHVHPNKNRRLSIYESMLLQGFPKSFELKGTFSQQVTQISNAVPPPMAKIIAKKIKITG
ncbi:MAG: DNA cytosine methyltransferase [Pantoea sp. Morm]|uniref:DNA cytosine methyltransferase n=1 Tax=Pantoea sp. Morm TaxID=2601250 RepID=UPI001DC7E2EB|nr:DNA cytosine methyltransferase [Pantoea sp. Morm]